MNKLHYTVVTRPTWETSNSDTEYSMYNGIFLQLSLHRNLLTYITQYAYLAQCIMSMDYTYQPHPLWPCVSMLIFTLNMAAAQCICS